MLGLDQADLAELALVHRNTIMGFEAGRKAPNRNNLLAIQAALETSGVEFIAENGGGAGVRLKSFKLKDVGENPFFWDDVSKFFAFEAIDGERPITICVEDLALEHFEDIRGGADYLQKLQKHRGRIFSIAARKYELGLVEPGETISVRFADVAG
jgi:transcriptional regulator with XRE-family HTH domain